MLARWVWRAMDAHAALTTRFESLSKGAYLDVLLPRASDFDAVSLIRDGTPEELARAPSRRIQTSSA